MFLCVLIQIGRRYSRTLDCGGVLRGGDFVGREFVVEEIYKAV